MSTPPFLCIPPRTTHRQEKRCYRTQFSCSHPFFFFEYGEKKVKKKIRSTKFHIKKVRKATVTKLPSRVAAMPRTLHARHTRKNEERATPIELFFPSKSSDPNERHTHSLSQKAIAKAARTLTTHEREWKRAGFLFRAHQCVCLCFAKNYGTTN